MMLLSVGKMLLLGCCLLYISWMQTIEASIHNLKYFETLHPKDFHVRTKRSASGLTDEKHVQFESLGKHFALRLKRRTGLLSQDFRVVSIGSNNEEKVLDLDTNILYHGHDTNDPSSYVQAYWEDENLMASIETQDDTFVIEPSWRQLPETSNHSMIAYRKSDVHMDEDVGKSYCGYVDVSKDASYSRAKEQNEFMEEEAEEEKASSRRKRQTAGTSKDSCPLLLVADYRFFQNMGQNSLSKTTSYLIGLVDRVDKLYRETDFGNNYVNMGFEIKEMRIHEVPTVTAAGETHYNDERDNWDTKELLEAFSVDRMLSWFCLGHLFTALSFPAGTLGLSYVASPLTYNPGGICSPAYYKQGYQLHLNTGWSSSLNRMKHRLLTSEADLVTTHEFGHNWGSEHDPDTEECSPGSFSGGKHIMYTYSVSGFEPNNRVFSPCSKRSMGAVLDSKHYNCFTAQQAAFCGNSNVEEGEQCDAGPATKKGTHPCCNKYCMLQPQAKCSDTNDICCSSCQFSPPGSTCYEQGPCEEQSVCTGNSKDCPEPIPKSNGTDCFDKGKCSSGVCQSFCESEGKISCICDNVTDSCLWCCRDNNTSPCEPARNAAGQTDNLRDGMPCVQGYCVKGVCEKQVQDLVERFWQVIVTLNPSSLVAFMRANIVGTVMVLSLIVWIPASCAIHHVDKKRAQQDEKERHWHAADNNRLVLDSDAARVRASTGARRVQSNIVRGTPHPYAAAPHPYYADSARHTTRM